MKENQCLIVNNVVRSNGDNAVFQSDLDGYVKTTDLENYTSKEDAELKGYTVTSEKTDTTADLKVTSDTLATNNTVKDTLFESSDTTCRTTDKTSLYKNGKEVAYQRTMLNQPSKQSSTRIVGIGDNGELVSIGDFIIPNSDKSSCLSLWAQTDPNNVGRRKVTVTAGGYQNAKLQTGMQIVSYNESNKLTLNSNFFLMDIDGDGSTALASVENIEANASVRTRASDTRAATILKKGDDKQIELQIKDDDLHITIKNATDEITITPDKIESKTKGEVAWKSDLEGLDNSIAGLTTTSTVTDTAIDINNTTDAINGVHTVSNTNVRVSNDGVRSSDNFTAYKEDGTEIGHNIVTATTDVKGRSNLDYRINFDDGSYAYERVTIRNPEDTNANQVHLDLVRTDSNKNIKSKTTLSTNSSKVPDALTGIMGRIWDDSHNETARASIGCWTGDDGDESTVQLRHFKEDGKTVDFTVLDRANKNFALVRTHAGNDNYAALTTINGESYTEMCAKDTDGFETFAIIRADIREPSTEEGHVHSKGGSVTVGATLTNGTYRCAQLDAGPDEDDGVSGNKLMLEYKNALEHRGALYELEAIRLNVNLNNVFGDVGLLITPDQIKSKNKGEVVWKSDLEGYLKADADGNVLLNGYVKSSDLIQNGKIKSDYLPAQTEVPDNVLTKDNVDNALNTTSENPVQNKVIKAAIDSLNSKINTSAVPTGSVGDSNVRPIDGTTRTGHGEVDDSLVPDLGANRLAFIKPSAITVERSSDGGNTWAIATDVTDATKSSLFVNNAASIPVVKSEETPSTNWQLRITVDNSKSGVYSVLYKYAIYVSTNGSKSCYCDLYSSRDNVDYRLDSSGEITGLSGWNIINKSLMWGSTAQNASTRGYVRFVFRYEDNSDIGIYKGLGVIRILGFGGEGWDTPSNMAKNNHLYSFDYAQNAVFPAKVQATDFTIGTTNVSELISQVNELKNSMLTKQDFTIDNLYSYGVEWTESDSVTTPVCTRVGNMNMHKTLPIQSQFKGCIVKDKKVVYFLKPDDWSKKEDGTEAKLDGTDGSVCVWHPTFYIKGFNSVAGDDTKRQVRISLFKIDDSWYEVKEGAISAYQSCYDNVNQCLCSVVNKDPRYRGGNKSTAYDSAPASNAKDTRYAEYSSTLNKPSTSTSRANFRKQARKNNFELLSYLDYIYVLYWMMVIEYSTFFIQDNAFNSELTAEGYHQGGLGVGVTNFGDTAWSKFNAYNPIIPNGYTNALGNFSGNVPLTIERYTDKDLTIYAAVTMNVPRYRGIENPFGHLWKNLDGTINQYIDGVRKWWVTDNPEYYSDTSVENMTYIGNSAPTNGYVREWLLGDKAYALPISTGGGWNTRKTDYYYTNTDGSMHALVCGGSSSNGSYAGPGCFTCYNSVSYSPAHYGSFLYTKIEI